MWFAVWMYIFYLADADHHLEGRNDILRNCSYPLSVLKGIIGISFFFSFQFSIFEF